jgi:hypothetical protein
MSSTINGNAGVAAYTANAKVSLIPVDTRGAATGVPVQAAVSSTGAYQFLGVAAGYYKLTIIPPQPNSVMPTPPVLVQNNLYCDGSTTYYI